MKSTNISVISVLISTLMAGALCAAANVKDYAGQALDDKDFKNGNLNGAKFDGASLKRANFTNATCKNAIFRGAKLESANFTNANLEGADFTGAELKDATFCDTKAWHANFSGGEINLTAAVAPDYSKIENSAARQTLMSHARRDNGTLSFHYADLHNALILGDAKDVDFRNADLRGADLSNVINLKGARLGNAKYDENTNWKIDPKEAGAEFVSASSKAADSIGATNPIVGKWLILKGEGDAPDNGMLRILADHTFEWDPALSAEKSKLLSGSWREVGQTIEIKGGELGQTWTATKADHHGKPELQLQSEKESKRVAVPEQKKERAASLAINCRTSMKRTTIAYVLSSMLMLTAMTGLSYSAYAETDSQRDDRLAEERRQERMLEERQEAARVEANQEEQRRLDRLQEERKSAATVEGNQQEQHRQDGLQDQRKSDAQVEANQDDQRRLDRIKAEQMEAARNAANSPKAPPPDHANTAQMADYQAAQATARREEQRRLDRMAAERIAEERRLARLAEDHHDDRLAADRKSEESNQEALTADRKATDQQDEQAIERRKEEATAEQRRLDRVKAEQMAEERRQERLAEDRKQ